jgi:hypothetical protein
MLNVQPPPTLSRKCSKCEIEKPITEYYSRGGDKYLPECKDCTKIRSRQTREKRKYNRNDRTVSFVPTETAVIRKLHSMGIPALPGKALAQTWADVIIGGALLCEVKAAKIRDGKFGFNFTHSQQHNRLRGDIIVLVCIHDTGDETFHVFPSNHPMMFKKNGKMRGSLSYTPNRGNAGKKAVLTDDMMKAAENNWQLVHDYLRMISDQLRFGAQLPILINKAA